MSVIMTRHNNVSSDQSPVTLVPVKFKTTTSQSPSIEQTKDNTETVKNCCRVFVELMFTQVNNEQAKNGLQVATKVTRMNNNLYCIMMR